MNKKYLLISGSPRNGNTDFILTEIFNKLKGRKEILFLRDKNIKHCEGCLSCHNRFDCIIKDDMAEIREKILNTDVFIIGTPRYFDNMTGLLKDFIDRLHPFYRPELLKNKKVILIMVGGGEIESSSRHLAATTSGLIKYLKLDLVGSFCFKALHSDELRQDTTAKEQIENIVQKINSI